MPRLVTFGDSYTLGLGLPDAWPFNNLKNNKIGSLYAWPKLLSDKLNFELLNLAKGGAGNLEILWKIMSTSFDKDDIVIILWSHFTRLDEFIFLNPDNLPIDNLTDKNPAYKEKKEFLKMSGFRLPKGYQLSAKDLDYDLATRNYLLMNHGSLFLKNKNIKSYHLIATFENEFPIHENIFIENLLDIGPESWRCDKALDNMHPGVESQKLLASLIYDKIKQ